LQLINIIIVEVLNTDIIIIIIIIIIINVKLKFTPEGPEGEQRYNATLSLTSALDGVGG
jgi:hypothetical protein